MLFKEMDEIDKWGAYSDFVTVAEAERIGLIPPSHVGLFPHTCGKGNMDEGCGSEVIISKNLTSIMCCNPRCWIKVAFTLDYMFDAFDCKGVGIQSCKRVVRAMYDTWEFKSHLSVFGTSDRYFPFDFNGAAYVNFKEAMHKVSMTPITFPNMISKLGIPGFDATAKKVFENFTNVQEMVSAIKSAGGFQRFFYARGIEDPKKSFYLAEFLKDIAYAQSNVFKNIKMAGKLKISICITGSLKVQGVKVSQSQFCELAMSVGTLDNGIRLFDIVENSAIETNDYVISDFASGSSKRLIAERRERDEGYKIIYTAEEFLEYLKEVKLCVIENRPLPERKKA